MKNVKSTFYAIMVTVFVQIASFLLPTDAFSQCFPMIKIDGNQIIADENNAYGIKLPSWLKSGQTLAIGNNVFSISVIEFTVNGTALDYSQNLSVTTVQTVPAGKVWKIESIHKDALVLPPASATYTSPGTYTYTPSCSGIYTAKVWGGGGGGGGGDGASYAQSGGGGGGGGYAEGSFLLAAGTGYTVTVGAVGAAGPQFNNGGAGGTSSVGTININATGGGGGTGSPQNNVPGVGGAGGIGSGAQINLTGAPGANGSSTNGGNGGTGANGGVGATVDGGAGTPPGGGGSGCYNCAGGAGSAGRVEIAIGGGSSGGGGTGASRDKLQVSGSVNIGVNTTCQYVVPSGKIFRLDAVTTTTNGSTLYIGSSCGASDRGTITIYNPTSGNTATPLSWPYPQWYGAGTYFYYTAGTAYLQGLEFVIE